MTELVRVLISLIGNTTSLSILIVGILLFTYLIVTKSDGLNLFGIQISGAKNKPLNDQIREGLRIFENFRIKILELYSPVRSFIMASVIKTCGNNDRLLYKIVSHELDLGVWRIWKNRFLQNHFSEIKEDRQLYQKEINELSYNMRFAIVNALLLERSDFQEDTILPSEDMKTLQSLIESAINRYHYTKVIVSQDNNIELKEINTSLRNNNF